MTAHNGYLLGLDVGNTNVKCVAISQNGLQLGLFRRSTESVRADNEIGLDCDRLMALIIELLSLTTQQMKKLDSASVPLGIAVSSMGCVNFLLDSENRQIHVPILEPLSTLPKGTYQKTGYPEDYANSGARLKTLSEQSPETAGKIYSILSVGEYITYRLCGQKAATYSHAGSTSLLDKEHGRWWFDFTQNLGIRNNALPPLIESGTRLGGLLPSIAEATGLPRELPVSSGGHDYLCAAYAAGCIDETKSLVLLGSFEMVASFAAKPARQAPPDDIVRFWDHHVFPAKFAHTAEFVCAAQIEWLRKRLMGNPSEKAWSELFSQLNDLEILPPNKNTPTFIPRIMGDSFWRLKQPVTGGFTGLHQAMETIDFLRCGIEGLNLFSKGVIERCLTSGSHPSQITVLGGGARNRFWITNKADILGQPLYLPEIEEASAVGAALLAGVGSGIYSGHQEGMEIATALPVRVVEPNPARSREWNEIYQQRFLPALQMMHEADIQPSK